MACRCSRCKEARAEYRRDARAKKMAEVKARADRDGEGQSFTHGKPWNYTSGKCLCRLCKGAASEASRKYKQDRLAKDLAEAQKKFDEQWGEF